MKPIERSKKKKYKYLACTYCGSDLDKTIITGKYCKKCMRLLLGK